MDTHLSQPSFYYCSDIFFTANSSKKHSNLIATILPIDKIIGKIYPVLGLLLLLSAIGVAVGMFMYGNPIPELTLANLHPKDIPYYPVIFLTISWGALSGFHATQSPIIARTVKNEKDGRKIFYGMMIVEGVIAMIWAAAAMSLVSGEDLSVLLENEGLPGVVIKIATVFLGTIGGTIAILGVIVLPITSGDTSFRAARMIIADYLKIDQKALRNRFMIAIPLFVIAFILTKIDFQLLWRYFFLGQSKHRGNCLMGRNRLSIPKEYPLYYCLSTCIFYNIRSRVLSFL